MPEPSVATVVLIVVAALSAAAVLGALHVWYAAALSRVFAAHDTEPWRAWVPVLNEAELFRLGRQDPVKAALFLVPVVCAYAIVLRALAAARLGREGGRSPALVALAVVLPPLWATLLAAPRPARADRMATPVAPVAGAPAAATPVLAAPALTPPAQTAPHPPAPLATPAPPASVTPPTPAVPDAADAQPLTRRAAARRRAELEDATAIVRAPAGWRLSLPDGTVVALTARTVLLGRSPGEEAGAQSIEVADASRTVSKRHARLEWNGREWLLTDLASTNGVTLDRDGDAEPLAPGVATAAAAGFSLGDARLRLHRGR